MQLRSKFPSFPLSQFPLYALSCCCSLVCLLSHRFSFINNTRYPLSLLDSADRAYLHFSLFFFLLLLIPIRLSSLSSHTQTVPSVCPFDSLSIIFYPSCPFLSPASRTPSIHSIRSIALHMVKNPLSFLLSFFPSLILSSPSSSSSPTCSVPPAILSHYSFVKTYLSDIPFSLFRLSVFSLSLPPSLQTPPSIPFFFLFLSFHAHLSFDSPSHSPLLHYFVNGPIESDF